MAGAFGSGSVITFPAPAVLRVDGGPLTLLAVMRRTNDASYACPISSRTSGGTVCWFLELVSTNSFYGTGATSRDIGSFSGSDWRVFTGRKANGGSVNPTGRILTITGTTGDSGDVVAGSTLTDGTAVNSGGELRLGMYSTTDPSANTEIAAWAAWPVELAGSVIATFTSWAAIQAEVANVANPGWSYRYGDATDSAGQTPTITSVTTVADPSGFFTSSVAGVLTGAGGAGSGVILGGGRSAGVLAGAGGVGSGVILGGGRSAGVLAGAGGAGSGVLLGTGRSAAALQAAGGASSGVLLGRGRSAGVLAGAGGASSGVLVVLTAGAGVLAGAGGASSGVLLGRGRSAGVLAGAGGASSGVLLGAPEDPGAPIDSRPPRVAYGGVEVDGRLVAPVRPPRLIRPV